MTKKDVADKYGVQKNALSTWAKSKEKLLYSIERGSNA